jgi:hypothetical protein
MFFVFIFTKKNKSRIVTQRSHPHRSRTWISFTSRISWIPSQAPPSEASPQVTCSQVKFWEENQEDNTKNLAFAAWNRTIF